MVLEWSWKQSSFFFFPFICKLSFFLSCFVVFLSGQCLKSTVEVLVCIHGQAFQVCYAAADYHINTFWSFVPDLMEFWLCESPATYLLPPYTNLSLWCKWSWLLPCSFSEKWTSQERMKRARIIWLSNMKTEWEVIWLLSVMHEGSFLGSKAVLAQNQIGTVWPAVILC